MSNLAVYRGTDPLAAELMEIERNAQQTLSNYAGQHENNYAGFPDNDGDPDLVSFAGNVNSFETEHRTNLFFKLFVKNTSANDADFFLTPGLLYAPNAPLADGVIRTGLFPDAAGNYAALQASTNSGNSIENLLAFIYHNPTRVPLIKIKHSSSDQASQLWEREQMNPFRSEGFKPIEIDSANDGNTFNDKITVIREGLQFDNQTRIKARILAGQTMDITIYVGAMLNPSVTLNVKAVKASTATMQKVQAVKQHMVQTALGGR